MKSILHAYFTRVFIPLTATLLFAIILLFAMAKTDERGTVLLVVAYFCAMMLSVVAVVLNFLLLKLINPTYDYKLRNDLISFVYIFFVLYFLITAENLASRLIFIFFLVSNVAIIFYCKKKQIM